ncbi:tetratricopeptide repeat-containing diguanylate cyclase [Undibacterium cyanobacteriorum]|uniref:diguanylate cyclase n=1 Tax=Undibacterium cyanobacteriorum TaxID=3073561 RepID=A0ABY9RH45_9BURK|nr:tetratricopeptide repeat-containing diguanylate cyclase [Undibacterium sp. 20NA77.5]WMW80522.1 tetratricopeptide repeat-containing diguanylate cyclase [Undibacterium sp. 20NA77.5]
MGFAFITPSYKSKAIALVCGCSLLLMANAKANAAELNSKQKTNLEEISARSQQSYPATETLIASELQNTTDPHYRLQLLTKQAEFLDLYRRQDLLLKVAQEGQALAQELGLNSARVFFQVMEADALNFEGKLYDAMRIHQKLAPSLPTSDSETRYWAALSLARTHMALNQNELATKELNTVIEADGAQASLKSLAMLDLADLQINIGLFAKSLDYFRKAVEITPPTQKQISLYAEMGVARSLNTLKKREEALTKIDSVIKEFHQSGNLSGEAYALLLKGYFLAKLTQFAKAEAPYLEAAALYERIGSPRKISNIYTHLSGNYADLKKPDKALMYGEKSLALAVESDDLNLQWDAYASLGDAEAAAGKYKQAHQHMVAAFEIFQKSSRQTLDSQTILIREQFDTERKEKENAILAEKLAIESLLLSNKKREIWILSIVTGIMALASFALLFAYRRTRYLAQHDGLTGLLNRRQIIHQGDVEFQRAKRYQTPLAIVSFDIDHFKEINDQHGHAEGDRVLKCVGAVCKEMVRGSDFAGRLGGEEFLIVLTHSDKEGAFKFAERLREKITEVVHQKTNKLEVTASFGVVQLSNNDANFESLLQRADVAMYHAKARGRNQSSTTDLQVVSGL